MAFRAGPGGLVMVTHSVGRAHWREIGSLIRRCAAICAVGLSVLTCFNAFAFAQGKVIVADHDALMLADKINTAVKWHCIPQSIYDAWSDQAAKLLDVLNVEIDAAERALPQVEREQHEGPGKERQDKNIKSLKNKIESDKAAFRALEAAIKSASQHICTPEEYGSRTNWTGGYLGGELAKNWGLVRSTESLATTDVVTNQFKDSGDPLGVGIVGGYNFKPWNNNVVIGAFASFDYLNQTINHNFAGGQFLGTTTHWFIDAGVKAGVVTAPGFYLYGLAGVAFLNHDLNVNFVTAAQSNTTTPGFTAGFGGEYQPPSWKLAGHPVSVFAQYQHTWWSNANFNTPTSSPAFNYAFKRDDDTIKLGVNFYFGAPPAPAAPAFPVKAPMLK